jgi:hypothetical protein
MNLIFILNMLIKLTLRQERYLDSTISNTFEWLHHHYVHDRVKNGGASKQKIKNVCNEKAKKRNKFCLKTQAALKVSVTVQILKIYIIASVSVVLWCILCLKRMRAMKRYAVPILGFRSDHLFFC